ncbi:MAG: response regulator [Planctomycetota bacterium]
MGKHWYEKILPFHKKPERTALVVDDDPEIVRLLTFHLTKLGFDVLAAERPSSALTYVKKRKRRLHLIVMDVKMPERNGPVLAKELRRHRVAVGAPLLFISGAFSERDLSKLQASFPGSHILHKPFTLLEFQRKMEYIFRHDKTPLPHARAG